MSSTGTTTASNSASLAFGEMVCNQLESALFVAYGKKKEAFLSSLSAPPKDDFDSYIKPYTLSAQDKMEETYLFRIISKKPKENETCTPLTADFIESQIRLEPPKRVVQHQYVPSSSVSTAKVLPRASSNAALAPSTMAVSSSRTAPIVARPAVSLPSSISSSSLSSRNVAASSVNINNLYIVIKDVFKRYWDMEFDDPITTSAFFANIHAGNAHEFHLPTFAPQSTSLTIINNRIESRQYASIEAFKVDMETMFGNIIRFFPESSLPHVTAQQLYRQFQSEWTSATAGSK